MARVIVIGAGVGGLVAAALLAARGEDVTVLERAASPGGKMREVAVGSARIDGGPTVFTMKPVFEEIFEAAGTSLTAELTLRPVEVLARHAWGPDERLDLYADLDRSADAIAAFAGPDEGRRFRDFAARAKGIHDTLDRSFMQAQRPSPVGLARNTGFRLDRLFALSPFSTLWSALGQHFQDPRLRQLYGRYATYCGSSPFAAPATLMLVAHVEQEGVWLVEGGMHQVAVALRRVAEARGARFRFGAEVTDIEAAGGAVTGVTLASGERLPAEAIVYNGDVGALADGRVGLAGARSARRVPRQARSLSAVTWTAHVQTRGFPLSRHTVFFSRAYKAEFDAIFRDRRLPDEPTVYVCAQDRGDDDPAPRDGPERLLILVNAPPDGDATPMEPAEIERCRTTAYAVMARAGLEIDHDPARTVTTTPTGFDKLFPGTGGALYGRASHGWMASFQRPGGRTRLPGLYLAGGSVHPGPGVPMAALSGRLAAEALLTDLASTRSSPRTAMRGGTSTASAPTGVMGSR